MRVQALAHDNPSAINLPLILITLQTLLILAGCIALGAVKSRTTSRPWQDSGVSPSCRSPPLYNFHRTRHLHEQRSMHAMRLEPYCCFDGIMLSKVLLLRRRGLTPAERDGNGWSSCPDPRNVQSARPRGPFVTGCCTKTIVKPAALGCRSAASFPIILAGSDTPIAAFLVPPLVP